LVLVRQSDLGEEREDLVGPAEHDDVAVLDHARTALAEVLDAFVQPVRQDADERTHHEQSVDRDEYREQRVHPAGGW